MKSFFTRYQQGECEQVWNELYTLGPAVRKVDVYPDAEMVAVETMRRARQNIELLIPRLEEIGYAFGYAWAQEEAFIGELWIAHQPPRYTPPPPNIDERIQHFEEQAGLLPLSVRAFYREVGGVNFVGQHSSWEHLFSASRTRSIALTNLDPLFVRALNEDIFTDYTEWQSGEEESLYPLPIAPDYEFKYYTSGAGAYEIEIPNAAADAKLLGEWHQTTFVNYLRICLHYGGLPGLQYISHLILDELAYLRKDLLPL